MGLAPGRAAPVRVRAAAAVRDAERRAELQRLQVEGRGARARAAGADLRQRRLVPAWSTSRAATPSAPASPHAIEFHGGDALERPPPPLPADLPGTLMVNPPYGERIEVAGKAGSAARRARGPLRGDDDGRGAGPRRPHAGEPASDRDAPSDFFPRLAAHWKHAYTGASRRLDGVDPEPRHEAAERDAPEGIAPRADVERADRVPPVPLRPRRRLGARRRPRARPARVRSVGAPTRREPRQRDRGQQHRHDRAEVEPGPALRRDQRARAERGERHRREDRRVHRRLRARLLFRPVRGREQRGAADEEEVPADAEREQRDQEVLSSTPDSATAMQTPFSTTPAAMTRRAPKRLDQVAGEEARHEHAEHVPLEHERGVGEGMRAHAAIAIGVAAISRFITP